MKKETIEELKKALANVRSGEYSVERHGVVAGNQKQPNWALYMDRLPGMHGLNVLSINDLDQFGQNEMEAIPVLLTHGNELLKSYTSLRAGSIRLALLLASICDAAGIDIEETKMAIRNAESGEAIGGEPSIKDILHSALKSVDVDPTILDKMEVTTEED